MPITSKTIIVDAGHGGIDPGAMTDDQSVKEKDVNLKIAKKVKELIEPTASSTATSTATSPRNSIPTGDLD